MLTDLYLPPAGAHLRSTHANQPQTNTKISAVRQQLNARLPEYMVPSQIVVLEEFPLTSSGKVDRKALPAPMFAATSFRAPQTETEEILAGIYAQVLGLERVGVDDSFFDLGGDSLLAMRVVAAINSGLNEHLDVRALFEAPSVAELAPRIGGDGGGLEPLVAVARPAVVPLSFAQQRLWFIDQLQGPSPIYNMAVALRLVGRLDVDALAQALADVVGRHESLRTLFVAPAGVPQSWWCRSSRSIWVGRLWMPSDGPRVGLGEAIESVSRYTFDLATEIPLHKRGFSGSLRFGGCWWRWCIISPPTGGRSRRWWLISGWPMPPPVRRGRRRGGMRCRCSMSITRCGSVHSWATSTIPRAVSLRSPACWETALSRDAELELPTDRPYPPVADYRGASVGLSGQPSCRRRSPGWPMSTTRPPSWWSRPRWRCCFPS